MRIALTALAAIVTVVLGCVQIVATVALRDRAQAGAWVRFVPESFARRVDGVSLAWPLPPELVLVLAGRAIDEGDTARARTALDRLPPTPDRLALEGRLAAARGDDAAAARAYLAAGDLDDIEARVTELRQQLRFVDALALQRALIARLSADPTQRDTLAQADYRLGQLEENVAYRYWPGTKKRKAHERAAAAAYENALGLSPAQERYLIAYGNQLLNVERFADARAVFVRASSVDAGDSTPLAGLGEAELRTGRRSEALAALARARRLNARDPAVVRLAREIGA